MKPSPFNLHRPTTLEEAVELLAQLADDGAIVLAGGQSLVPMMALRLAYPGDLIDINSIHGLERIEVQDDWLAIGALVRHHDFRHDVAPRPLGGLLKSVASHISHYPIRTRGTFCGSIAHADPASEWCLTAVTLGAEIVLVSRSGRRSVQANDFFEGAMTTVRAPEELLVEVRLARPHAESQWGFYEFNRRAGDFAIGAALAGYRLEDGVMCDVRVGLGAIEQVPRRLLEVEAALEGKEPSADIFRKAAAAATKGLDPMQDYSTQAEYRRDLSITVVHRALVAADAAGTERKGIAA